MSSKLILTILISIFQFLAVLMPLFWTLSDGRRLLKNRLSKAGKILSIISSLGLVAAIYLSFRSESDLKKSENDSKASERKADSLYSELVRIQQENFTELVRKSEKLDSVNNIISRR